MILLLESKEDMVLLKALSSLDKFAGKLEQNAKVLHEEGVLKSLTPLLEHSNLYIQRFSTKLLSELCFNQAIVNQLLEEFDGLLLNMLNLLHKVNDSFVKEFSASVVAELTKTRHGYDQLIETNMINILIPLLSSPDPDVQYNCLKIIQNIIVEPNDKTVLTEDSSFSVKPFVNLLSSEYVAIQNTTLDILHRLTEQTKLNPIPKQFQDAGGVVKLLAIVKNYEWKDIHGKALDVLANIYNDTSIAQTFLKDGVMQLIAYVDLAKDPQLKKGAVEVLSKIAETPLGRKVLLDSGYIPRLVEMLSDHDDVVCSAACVTVANLCQDLASLRQLADLLTVQQVLNILTVPDRSWPARGAAIHTLYEILKRDSDACTYIADHFEMGFIEKLLNEFDENVSLQAAVTAANCVTTLAGYADLREKIINENLISSLLHCFKDYPQDTSVLKLAVCETLCSLLSELRTQDLLHNLDSLSVVWYSITKHHNNIQLLQSAATFVHLCVSGDKRFTPTLLRLGVLNWYES
ncbi:armadillo repeat-containing protein 3-like [Macrosteles quadrilineatus]|uniref:armadillo repeat-containing protein 3-like n=1 Tax=Macrosteles quadrilineatus TaxID=74068 RepID=UPI0023E25A4A|nr:armadillo repeat-containing protein 3-like [Macrosteles quadrilineatus]